MQEEKPVKPWEPFDPDMIAETPEERRELAKYLGVHDPEMLAFIQAASKAFGLPGIKTPLKGVAYKYTKIRYNKDSQHVEGKRK